MSSSILYTFDELITATGGDIIGTVPRALIGVSGISMDTRTLRTGDAYFAIKGDVHDGHTFVSDALTTGAIVCVVSRDSLSQLDTSLIDDKRFFLAVDDVLLSLENLGRHSRERSDANIVAITGSVGKTTTKEMLKLALGESTHASQSSYNNHWGVPFSLSAMPSDSSYGIFEIGMNHPGEITPLVRMVRPHVALLNNVAPVHLAAFRNVEEIAYAKAEIFEGLSCGGIAILDRDNDWYDLLHGLASKKEGVRVLTFGVSSDSFSRLVSVESHGTESHITISLSGDLHHLRMNTLGFHMAKNASAILAILHSLNVDIPSCLSRLQSMRPVEGRGLRYELCVPSATPTGTFTLIDESYNANPASMVAAIDLLGQYPSVSSSRRIAVLGDMLELGETSDSLHISLHSAIMANKIDKLFLVGSHMRCLHDVCGELSVHADDIDSLIALITSELRADDILMAKASFGMGFSRLIQSLLRHFPLSDSLGDSLSDSLGDSLN